MKIYPCSQMAYPPDFCSDPRRRSRRSLARGRRHPTLSPTFRGEASYHQRPRPVLLGYGQFSSPDAGQRPGDAGARFAATGDLFLADSARLAARPSAVDRHPGFHPVHLYHDVLWGGLQPTLPGLCGHRSA